MLFRRLITLKQQKMHYADLQYDATFSSKVFDEHYTLKVRCYAVVKGAEGTKTIYSEVITIQL